MLTRLIRALFYGGFGVMANDGTVIIICHRGMKPCGQISYLQLSHYFRFLSLIWHNLLVSLIQHAGSSKS